MQNEILVSFVVIIVVVVTTVFVFTKSSYCNCTGMNSKTAGPALNLWNAVNGGMGDIKEYTGPAAYGMLSTAYGPSVWGALERNIATAASSGALNYGGGCACNTSTNSSSKIVPLSAVGGSVPPGAVSNGVASYPVNKGYTDSGYNTVPKTSFRYGAYADSYNPDSAVGIM